MTKKNIKKPLQDKDAAEIFLGVQRNRAGVDEWEDYKAFVEASPENAAEQQNLKAIWNDASGLSMDLLPSTEELAADKYDGEETVQAHLAKQRVPLRAEVGVTEQMIASLQSFFASMQPRTAIGAMALLLVALVTAVMWPGAAPVYTTGTAEHRRVTLDDGSSIMLGAETSVAVHYGEAERSILLTSGEAYFDVAKDASRPFVVDVGGLKVRAVGTAFNILSAPDDVLVSVTEGIVQVDTVEEADVSRTALLEVGDELEVSREDQTFTQREEDPSRMLFWQNDVLYFRGEQLKDIFHRIDRYTDQSVVLADDRVGELLFSGSINRHNIDSWLTTLPLAFPVRIDRTKDRIVILPDEG